MNDPLPCGHDREHLTKIDGQQTCYVCWAIDSGNYTFPTRHGYPTGPEVAHHEVSQLAAQVHSLAAIVAEQGRQLQRLLAQQDATPC